MKTIIFLLLLSVFCLAETVRLENGVTYKSIRFCDFEQNITIFCDETEKVCTTCTNLFLLRGYKLICTPLQKDVYNKCIKGKKKLKIEVD